MCRPKKGKPSGHHGHDPFGIGHSNFQNHNIVRQRLLMCSVRQAVKMANGMTPVERQKFNDSITLGVKHGAIDPASIAPPSAAQ